MGFYNDLAALLANYPTLTFGDITGLIINGKALLLTKNVSVLDAPEIHLDAVNGGWITGIDVANPPGARDYVVAAKKNFPNPGDVNDLIYIAHRGTSHPTIGLGVTPPDGSHRVQISPADAEPGMGGARIRVGPSQTGNILTMTDSAGVDRWWLDKDYYLKGAAGSHGASVAVKADATNSRSLVLGKADGTVLYGFRHSANDCIFAYITGGVDQIIYHTTGQVEFPSTLGIKLVSNFALGGGAAATLGTIGGSGPTVAAQNEWVKISTGSGVRFIPAWA